MKPFFKTLFFAIALILISCQKSKVEPARTATPESYNDNSGPLGKSSEWKSIGGDSLYEENLTLTLFYTEQSSPCDICHYHQNYSLWNDYSYTYSVSKCDPLAGDTLSINDPDTNRKAIFLRVK